MRRLLDDSAARLLQVCCHADGEVQLRRFLARAGTRHPGHRDDERLADLRARLLGPPPPAMDLPGVVLHYDSARPGDDGIDAVLAAITRVRGPAGS